MSERNIWVRGLIPNDRGKVIEFDGKKFLLRGFEHGAESTTLTVVTSIELPHKKEVTLHE